MNVEDYTPPPVDSLKRGIRIDIVKVMIRMTSEEKEMLVNAARAFDLPINQYIIWKLFYADDTEQENVERETTNEEGDDWQERVSV